MKKIFVFILTIASLSAKAQLPILVGSGGNNTGVTTAQLKDTATSVKNHVLLNYASIQSLADSTTLLKSLSPTKTALNDTAAILRTFTTTKVNDSSATLRNYTTTKFNDVVTGTNTYTGNNTYTQPLKLRIQTTTPATTNDTVALYFRETAKRRELAYVSELGDVSVMQRSFNVRNLSYYVSNGNGAFNNLGFGSFATLGTGGAIAWSAGTYKNHQIRSSRSTTAVAGNVAFERASTVECYGGEVLGGVNVGGYYFEAEFGFNATSATNNFFVGLVNSGAAPTNTDPLTTTAITRIGVAATVNTGNLKLIHTLSPATPTVIDLTNCPINLTDYYKLVIYKPPTNANTYVAVTNLQTNVTQNFTVNTNFAANTTQLARQIWISNDADAVIVGYQLTRMNLESR